MDAFEQAGADYRAAKDAVPEHLRKQAAAELALVGWLRDHDMTDPANHQDPERLRLVAAVQQAEADVAWCRALVIACGEVVKGCKFDDVPADRTVLRHPVEIVEVN